MELYRQQSEFVESTKPMLGFIGGVAAGKSVSGAHYALKKIFTNPGQVGLIFANTHKQLSQATLRVFLQVLTHYGMERDKHFVVDKNPQPFFGYASKFTDHSGVWSFSTGAQVMTFSLESSMRGIESNWCWGDEIQDADWEELKIILARVREKPDPERRFTMTPPAYNPAVRELLFGPHSIPLITATTWDNAHNLPRSFLETLNLYDQLTYDREVLAKDVKFVSNRWVYAMDLPGIEEKIFEDSLSRWPDVPVIFSFDFNKDPLTALAIQRLDNRIRVHKEYRLSNSNLDNICARIKADWWPCTALVTGDFTGKYGDSIVQSKFMNYYQKIGILLGVPENRFVLSPNPHHVNSREQVNSILQNHPDFKINKTRCLALVDDLYYVESKEDGTLDKTKDKRLTHQLDNLRYFFHNFEKDYNRQLTRNTYHAEAV